MIDVQLIAKNCVLRESPAPDRIYGPRRLFSGLYRPGNTASSRIRLRCRREFGSGYRQARQPPGFRRRHPMQWTNGHIFRMIMLAVSAVKLISVSLRPVMNRAWRQACLPAKNNPLQIDWIEPSPRPGVSTNAVFRVSGSRRSGCFPGFARDVGESSITRICANSPSTIRIMTTRTTRGTGVTGNCCVFIATTRNTRPALKPVALRDKGMRHAMIGGPRTGLLPI